MVMHIWIYECQTNGLTISYKVDFVSAMGQFQSQFCRYNAASAEGWITNYCYFHRCFLGIRSYGKYQLRRCQIATSGSTMARDKTKAAACQFLAPIAVEILCEARAKIV